VLFNRVRQVAAHDPFPPLYSSGISAMVSDYTVSQKKRTNFEKVYLEIIRIDFDDIWQKYLKYSVSSKSILIISSYTVSNFARFFLRHSI